VVDIPTVDDLAAGGDVGWLRLGAALTRRSADWVQATYPGKRQEFARSLATSEHMGRMADMGFRGVPRVPEPVAALVAARERLQVARASKADTHKSRREIAAAEQGRDDALRAAGDWHVRWSELVRGLINDTVAEPVAAPIPIGAPSWR
jgi:hypothetical protein